MSVMDTLSETPPKKGKIPFVRSCPLEIASCLGMNFHGHFFLLALVHPPA